MTNINNNSFNAKYLATQMNQVQLKQDDTKNETNEHELYSVQELKTGKYKEQGEMLLEQMSMLSSYNFAPFTTSKNSQISEMSTVLSAADTSLISENNEISGYESEVADSQIQVQNDNTNISVENSEENYKEINIVNEWITLDGDDAYITPSGIKISSEDIELPNGTKFSIEELQDIDEENGSRSLSRGMDSTDYSEGDEKTPESTRRSVTIFRINEDESIDLRTEYTIEEETYIDNVSVTTNINVNSTRENINKQVSHVTQFYGDTNSEEIYCLRENNILTFSNGKTVDLNDEKWTGFSVNTKKSSQGQIQLVRMLAPENNKIAREIYKLDKNGNIILYEIKQPASNNNVVTVATEYDIDGEILNEYTTVEKQPVSTKLNNTIAAPVSQTDKTPVKSYFVADTIKNAISAATTQDLQSMLQKLANWVIYNYRQGFEVNSYLLATIGSMIADEHFKKNFRKLY